MVEQLGTQLRGHRYDTRCSAELADPVVSILRWILRALRFLAFGAHHPSHRRGRLAETTELAQPVDRESRRLASCSRPE